MENMTATLQQRASEGRPERRRHSALRYRKVGSPRGGWAGRPAHFGRRRRQVCPHCGHCLKADTRSQSGDGKPTFAEARRSVLANTNMGGACGARNRNPGSRGREVEGELTDSRNRARSMLVLSSPTSRPRDRLAFASISFGGHSQHFTATFWHFPEITNVATFRTLPER